MGTHLLLPFLLILPFLAVLKTSSHIDLLYSLSFLGGISLVTFIVYWVDKQKAVKKKYRIPESTLHLLSLIGGWPGAYLAQQFIRHKNKKTKFLIFYWMTVTLYQIGCFEYYSSGLITRSLFK